MSEEVKPCRDGGKRGNASGAANPAFITFVTAGGLAHTITATSSQLHSAGQTTFTPAGRSDPKGLENRSSSRFLLPPPSQEGVNWFCTSAPTLDPPPPTGANVHPAPGSARSPTDDSELFTGCTRITAASCLPPAGLPSVLNSRLPSPHQLKGVAERRSRPTRKSRQPLTPSPFVWLQPTEDRVFPS